jgi:hypothetical protein
VIGKEENHCFLDYRPDGEKRVLYEQVIGVNRWSLFFLFSGSLLLLLSLPRMLLSTGFVFALKMSCS